MDKPYKVFGIGLNKTGTTSLKQALRRLGYTHARRETKLVKAWMAGDLDPIFANAEAFESFEDWPWPLVYRQMYEKYGDQARYILTVRSSADKWVNSLKKHAERTAGGLIRKGIFGYKYPHGVEAKHMAFYENHNAEVRAFFADKPNLFIELNWEQGDGWDKLCQFLSEPVPTGEFPHGNAGAFATPDPEVVAKNMIRIQRQLRRLKA